ncbi:MAG: tetratricopeptide repeat protein [Armatimonadetes bacterium]|nr:tetratricopeptide repeat protein [Armatimonadota bacterium]
MNRLMNFNTGQIFLKTHSQQEVATFLQRYLEERRFETATAADLKRKDDELRLFYVSPPLDGWVEIYELRDYEPDTDLAKYLSHSLKCTAVWVVSIEVDDAWGYVRYSNGQVVEEVLNPPEAFQKGFHGEMEGVADVREKVMSFHKELGVTNICLSYKEIAEGKGVGIESFSRLAFVRKPKEGEGKAREAFLNGEMYYNGRLYDLAVSAFQEAIQMDPGFNKAHQMLGNCYLNMRRIPDAIACFKKVTERDPHNATALALLGKAYLDTGSVEEALAEFQKAAEMDPEHPMVKLYLKQAKSKKKKWWRPF